MMEMCREMMSGHSAMGPGMMSGGQPGDPERPGSNDGDARRDDEGDGGHHAEARQEDAGDDEMRLRAVTTLLTAARRARRGCST